MLNLTHNTIVSAVVFLLVNKGIGNGRFCRHALVAKVFANVGKLVFVVGPSVEEGVHIIGCLG